MHLNDIGLEIALIEEKDEPLRLSV